ncbi:Nudix family hydrolase [Ectothiorhodospiraceae bacterium WFHF3C12]|nr:Nudix family hydrolase [Ectothiorhodospiraceae bacterium WFHF3C12]
MSGSAAGVVHVAVGVVADGQGRVLLAQRHAGTHQGGKWEFPGGKVEPGEHVVAALRRELAEEIGIIVEATEPLVRIPHDYGDRHVVLDVHRVTAFRGDARGLEGQPLEWVQPADLPRFDLPAANRPITAFLALPRACLVTPEVANADRFLAGIGDALRGGTRFVQLRRHDLAREELLAVIRDARDLSRSAGGVLVVNASPELALESGADGCHLSARAAAGYSPGRRPLPPGAWLGISCHDRAEIEHALSLRADYLFVSPVQPTPTHPDAVPLGWHGLRALIRDVPVPVFALGGVGPAALETARRHGAHGIAAIRGLWPRR